MILQSFALTAVAEAITGELVQTPQQRLPKVTEVQIWWYSFYVAIVAKKDT